MSILHNEAAIYKKDTGVLEPPERYGSALVVQVADITARHGWTVEPHVQFCHEIVLILEGEAIMACNTKRLMLSAGQMVMIPEGWIHDVRYVSPVHTRMLLVGIRLHEEADSFLRCFVSQPEVESVVRIVDYMPSTRMLMEMFIDEFFNRDGQSTQMLPALLSALLLQCARHYTDSPRDALDTLRIPKSADLLTMQLCEYIRDHAAEMTSLEELSQTFSYSYSYLSHHFKREAGCSIKDYWDHHRFRHVLQLMRDPTLSITQIAERVHYQSIHTFSRSFRTRFGVSPTEYRRTINS